MQKLIARRLSPNKTIDSREKQRRKKKKSKCTYIPPITNASAEDIVDETTRSRCTAIQAAIINCRWQATTAEVVLAKIGSSWMNVDDIVTLHCRQYLRGDAYVPFFKEQGIASDVFRWDKPL
jgi:hypothetical protein